MVKSPDYLPLCSFWWETADFFRSFQSHLFYSFLGIPYAKPPVGPGRFNYSEPIEPWNGVFDADRHMPCLQFEQSTSYIRGVEDCLVVSIYTPQLPSVEDPELIPVLVWLHGNDFHRGSGNADMQGPNRIMDYDVIMVTMNFRLGPLGFMTLEDDHLPGNLGLWDQKLALEWIQLNIASFGGNPEKITIGLSLIKIVNCLSICNFQKIFLQLGQVEVVPVSFYITYPPTVVVYSDPPWHSVPHLFPPPMYLSTPKLWSRN